MASAFENRLRRTIEMAGTDGQAGPVPVMAIPSDRGLVTPDPIADRAMLRPLSGTCAVLGDSRGELGWLFTTSGVLSGTRAMGWIAWMNYYLGSPMTYVQTRRASISGELTAQWADGHAELMALNPPASWVHITYPTNDVGYAATVADLDATKANMLTYIKDHLGRGSIVTLENAGNSGVWTTAGRSIASAMNAWINGVAQKYGLTVINRQSTTGLSDLTKLTTYYWDDTHENALGGHRQGFYAAKEFAGFARKRHFSGGPWNQALYNPGMIGGATLPIGWLAQGSGGTYSKVPRDDDTAGEFARCVATASTEAQSIGFVQQISLTAARANSTNYNGIGTHVWIDGNHYVLIAVGMTAASPPVFDTRIGGTTTDGTAVWMRVANIVPGVTRLRARCEARVSSSGGGAYPRIRIDFTPGTADLAAVKTLDLEPGHTIPTMQVLSGAPTPVITTPDFTVPVGTTHITTYVVASAANGATMTLDVGNVWFEPIE